MPPGALTQALLHDRQTSRIVATLAEHRPALSRQLLLLEVATQTGPMRGVDQRGRLVDVVAEVAGPACLLFALLVLGLLGLLVPDVVTSAAFLRIGLNVTRVERGVEVHGRPQVYPGRQLPMAISTRHRTAWVSGLPSLLVAADAGIVVGIRELVAIFEFDDRGESGVEARIIDGVTGLAAFHFQGVGVGGVVELDRRPLHGTGCLRKPELYDCRRDLSGRCFPVRR